MIEFLIERLWLGGCEEIRVVTRPEKRDVIEHARVLGASVILGRPADSAASLSTGLAGLGPSDVALFGFPDSIWDPLDGFDLLAADIEAGADIALGLFETAGVERPDVVSVTGATSTGLITDIDVGSEAPPPHLIWGAGGARVGALRGLGGAGDPGLYFRSLARLGAVAGRLLSRSYVDVGTRAGMRMALESVGEPV